MNDAVNNAKDSTLMAYFKAVNMENNLQILPNDGVVLCTHYPPYETNDPDLWNCKAGNGCIALQWETFSTSTYIYPIL